MRILFTMLSYNDLREGLGFYSNFVSEVGALGHEVTVVAPSLNGKTELHDEGCVRVLRVKTGKLFNVHPVIKGISNIRLPAVYGKGLDQHLAKEEFDWVVAPTPPVTLAPLVKLLKQRYSCPSYLILRDIFPQNARDLELINNDLVFSFFRRKERQLYNLSDQIGCMSQGNLDYVAEHNPELAIEKLSILPNWIANPETSSDIDSDGIKKKWGVAGKFVALFGGSFGKPQKIDSIIDLAKSVQTSHPDIVFFLVGGGTERKRIAELIEAEALPNVIMEDKLSQEDYMELASACDVGLVNLSDKFTIPNIPSRTLAYWASGLPVLASVDENTDLRTIITEVGGGLSNITGDLATYRSNLLALHDDRELRKSMGDSGRRAAVSRFDTKVVAQQFVDQLDRFMRGSVELAMPG